jgi:hypothetical protein
MEEKPYFTRKLAAKYISSLGLPITEQTLACMATNGGGPGFVKYGTRVIYPLAEIKKWIETKTSGVRYNTSGATEPFNDSMSI